MSKRMTLAQQLAEIAEPAPKDFDPEDSYATYGQEKSTEDVDLDAGRADYVDVGASKLRKKGQAKLDAKYDGKKGSRKELYDDDDDDEEEDEDEDEDEEMGEGSEGDSEGDFGDFDDLEAASGDSQGEEDDEEDEGEDEEDEESEEEEEEEVAPAPKAKVSRAAKAKAQDEKAMLSQLKQAASADVEKGRDVKKQLAFCDNVLEARIKLQKAATAANSLPQPENAQEFLGALPEEVEEVMAEIRELNEELFELRQDLIKTNEKLEIPSGLGQSRKRKRNGAEGYLAASLQDLTNLEAVLEPYLRSTITKWSDKVLAASGLAIGKDKKFKAVNQNAITQIDHALSPAERERLIKRSRVRRATATVDGGVKAKVIGKAEAIVLEGEKEKVDVDDEIFDDGDFYQQMLRDLVESRMLDLDDPTMASLRLASARGKKVKKVVDTRASKGRKIRYHVHEKIQNFMIPIDHNGWHDEQVDELFASLLGRTFASAAAVEDAAPAASGGAVDVGSLRLFG